MTEVKDRLFQGRDWSTYRWTVAEALDLIDRMHDRCLASGWHDEENPPPESDAEDLPSLLDALVAQVSFVLAELVELPCPPEKMGEAVSMITIRQNLQILAEILHDTTGEITTHKVSEAVHLLEKLKTNIKLLDS